ncbi:unnamed protein product [Cuscuta campestris]|uniref:Proline-rich protein PRCC n=1 Tax=Cuscuta campestris TaxID=132261 RepID=A0A484N5U2_9ASTE|nr:unnamed protein product [Cuscuta campestris]
MDLLANYASSEEEEEEEEEEKQESRQKQKHRPASFNSSKNSCEIASRSAESDGADDDLKSVDNHSSAFSLPLPKFSTSLISSLPPPKSSRSDPFNLPTPLAPSEPNLKRVVQFKPPSIPSGVKDDSDDDDDEDEDEKEKRKKLSGSATQNLSVRSFLSSLPAPKSSGALGATPLALGAGRKSVLETYMPTSDTDGTSLGAEVGVYPNAGYYEGQSVPGSTVSSSGAVDGGFQSEAASVAGEEGGYSQWVTQGEDCTATYHSYPGYGNGYGEHSNWVGGDVEQYPNYASSSYAQGLPESAESALRVTGKRRKNDAPPEIVEVNQDELMKDRPREDQSRLTGIAFGPAYKPASTKGKPSKLLKRKHQIGSLYFDMRQKEAELAERRSRGMLTKAQTQGKYGW